jgi:tetratricopeptide (TPR) repeat protein
MSRSNRQIGDRHATAIVIWFRIQRLIRALVLFVIGTGLLGAAGGYILALVGPEDWPTRKLADRYGLLPGHAAMKQALEEDLLAAREGYERGDIFDFERAEAHLARARKLDVQSGAIVGDQALTLSAHADALLRWADDLHVEANDPSVTPEQARGLRELAGVKQAQAEKVRASIDAVLKDAMRMAPSALETQRAIAHSSRLNRDDAGARQAVERAKELKKNEASDDPWMMAIEATLAADRPNGSSKDALVRSAAILRKALALDPDFHAARIQLARVLLDEDSIDLAEKELERVLKKAPTHGEARRLLARIKVASAKQP